MLLVLTPALIVISIYIAYWVRRSYRLLNAMVVVLSNRGQISPTKQVLDKARHISKGYRIQFPNIAPTE